MSGSIQRQLRRNLLAGLLVLTAAAGSALYLYVRSALLSQFDTALSAEADVLSVLVEHTRNDRIEFEFSPASMPQFAATSSTDYFEIRAEDGTIFAESPSLRGKAMAAPFQGPLGRPWDGVLPGGKPGRAIRIRFHPRQEVKEGGLSSPGPDRLDAPMTLVVARDRAEIDRPLKILLTSLLVTAGLLAAGTIVLVTTTLRRGFRPLRAVAEQAGGIDAERLAFRFPTDSLPAELRPICRRLNDLLARLEKAFARERRFTGDVAHELRTPIAELRSLSEVSLRVANGSGWDRQAAQDALSIARQMEQVVSTLLALARCQAGAQAVECRRTNLTQLVENLWQPLAARAAKRDLQTRFALPETIDLETDRTLLASMIGNLLSNAVAHTPAGGSIEIRMENVSDDPRLIIQNTNDQLSRGDLEHIFLPFWRKDTARSDNQHSGLGLSLVMEYVALLGMKLCAELPTDDTFRVVLTLSKPVHVRPGELVTI